MKVYELRRRTFIAAPLPAVFDFFSQAANLGTITPAFLHFRLLTPSVILQSGAELRYSLRIHGIPVRWTTRIEAWEPPHRFTDYQERGPYRLWHHIHCFRETPAGTDMDDWVRYALPLGIGGRLAHWLWVRRDLEAIFDYREEQIRKQFPGSCRQSPV